MEPLSQFPALPVGLELDVQPNDLFVARAELRLARQYFVATGQWAIASAGVFKRNADRYNGVTDCLDDARRRGLIQ